MILSLIMLFAILLFLVIVIYTTVWNWVNREKFVMESEDLIRHVYDTEKQKDIDFEEFCKKHREEITNYKRPVI